jgi:hypothetical protein
MDAKDLSITFVNMHGRIKEGTRSISPEFAASIIQSTSMLMSQRSLLLHLVQPSIPLTPRSHHETYSPIQVLPTQQSPAVWEILRL